MWYKIAMVIKLHSLVKNKTYVSFLSTPILTMNKYNMCRFSQKK